MNASTRDDLLQVLTLASEIWDVQANIQLELTGDIVRLPPRPGWTKADLLRTAGEGAIAGFAFPKPRGPNGKIINGDSLVGRLARTNIERFVIRVADHPAVPAERVFAHELGHILFESPDHPTEDPGRLMASGECGTHLTDEEIRKARKRATELADLR